MQGNEVLACVLFDVSPTIWLMVDYINTEYEMATFVRTQRRETCFRHSTTDIGLRL
jgi:hypothetical protein